MSSLWAVDLTVRANMSKSTVHLLLHLKDSKQKLQNAFCFAVIIEREQTKVPPLRTLLSNSPLLHLVFQIEDKNWSKVMRKILRIFETNQSGCQTKTKHRQGLSAAKVPDHREEFSLLLDIS